jgi:hypothetical protein
MAVGGRGATQACRDSSPVARNGPSAWFCEFWCAVLVRWETADGASNGEGSAPAVFVDKDRRGKSRCPSMPDAMSGDQTRCGPPHSRALFSTSRFFLEPCRKMSRVMSDSRPTCLVDVVQDELSRGEIDDACFRVRAVRTGLDLAGAEAARSVTHERRPMRHRASDDQRMRGCPSVAGSQRGVRRSCPRLPAVSRRGFRKLDCHDDLISGRRRG